MVIILAVLVLLFSILLCDRKSRPHTEERWDGRGFVGSVGRTIVIILAVLGNKGPTMCIICNGTRYQKTLKVEFYKSI